MIQSKVLAAAALAVLMSGSMAAQSYAAGKSYCRSVAEDYADRKTGAQQVVPGLVGGAIAGGLIGSVLGGKKSVRTGVLVGGAVAGGLLGAVIGGKHAVRTGIIAGGVTGGVLGGVHANKKWERVYWRAYEDCRSW